MSNEPLFVETTGDGETREYVPIPVAPMERGEHGVYTVPVTESTLGRKVGDENKQPNDEEGVH